jgi:predicted nucleic acid-binding protein
MINLFFDSSALYSAIFSSTGAARELLKMAMKDEIITIISQDVIVETSRNLSRKAPELVGVLERFLLVAPFKVVESPAVEDVQAAKKYVVAKDAFIVAAAMNVHADYLVTFDRKHLIDPPEVTAQSGLRIGTAGDALYWVRRQL